MKKLLFALALALVFVMGREAAAPPSPTAEAAPLGFQVQKSCTSNTVAVGATITCTTTITAPFAICPCFQYPAILTIAPQDTGAGPNPTYGRVVLQPGTTVAGGAFPVLVDPAAISNPADGSPQTITITCSATAPDCDFSNTPFDSIVITEVIKGAVGGVVTQVLSYPGTVFPPAPPDVLQSVTVLPAPTTASVACVPPTIVNNSGPAGATTCTATFSDTDIFPTTVASGNVAITLTGATGTVLTSTGTTTGTFRCGAFPNSPQGCSTVTFGVQSNAGSPAVAIPASGSSVAPVAAATGPAGVQVTYTPDLGQVNAQYLNNFANALNVTPGAVPNTPASLTVAGPASIACGATGSITATLRDGGGTLVAAPTQVGFSTSLGIIASPMTTAAGVATTTLAAPATGGGGNALVTATSGALTAQTLVPLTACAGAPAVASVSVAGPSLAIACGTVGTITATVRDAGGALMATPTQVNFTTSAGVMASPVTTVNGVATTTLAAPSTGPGATAVVTATGAGVTSQAVVVLGACAAAPTTTAAPTAPFLPYVPYFQPAMPYYPPAPAYVPLPPAQPQQPIINIYNVLPTPVAQTMTLPPAPGPQAQGVSVSRPVVPATFRPPNTGDAGLASPLHPTCSIFDVEGAQPLRRCPQHAMNEPGHRPGSILWLLRWAPSVPVAELRLR